MLYGRGVQVVSALLLLALASGGLALLALRLGDDPESVLIDEQAGALDGVNFGDSEAEVVRRLGDETDDRPGYFSAGRDYTGPFSIPAPASDQGSRIAPSALHYGDSAYLVSPTAGVFSMTTSSEGGRTRAGVEVGDRLALVRERYTRVRCGKAVGGEPLVGGNRRRYDWCRAVVGDTRLFFGADPVASITITSYAQ